MESEPNPLVAVVDDEASVRRAIVRLLRAASYRAEGFGSATDFLASLASRFPACLILDLQMPEMGGLELQERLLELNRPLPVIVITAYDEPGSRRRCRALGIRSYFRKPVEADDIIRAVGELVEYPGAS